MNRRDSVKTLIFAIVMLILCLTIGYFEFTRARAGNPRSWVYTFEWPFFGAFGIYMWWRLSHGDWEKIHKYFTEDDENDPQLMAWREYQAKMERENPVGGPPSPPT